MVTSTGTVKCRNPQNGVVYVYTYENYIDPETNEQHQRRRCIGHVDPITKETVPNAPRGARRGPRKKQNPEATPASAPQGSGDYEAVVQKLNEAMARIVTLEQEAAALKQENSRLAARQERMIQAIEKAIRE